LGLPKLFLRLSLAVRLNKPQRDRPRLIDQ